MSEFLPLQRSSEFAGGTSKEAHREGKLYCQREDTKHTNQSTTPSSASQPLRNLYYQNGCVHWFSLNGPIKM